MLSMWRCWGRTKLGRFLPVVPWGVTLLLRRECGLSFLKPPVAVSPHCSHIMDMSAPLSVGAHKTCPCPHRGHTPLLRAYSVPRASDQKCLQDRNVVNSSGPHCIHIWYFHPWRGFLWLLSWGEMIRGLATKERRSRDFQVERGDFGELEKHLCC